MNTDQPDTARVAVVTGAGDGIGLATAQRLARDFEHVVIADVRPAAAFARAAELGQRHLGVACDVTNESDVVGLFDAVLQRFGRLDVLVNNAGIGEQSVMTLEQTVEGFDRILAVHLRGTFLASREAARHFVAQQSGAIVNLGSIAGLAGHPGRNAYGAAKAGIVAMTEAMASEWARDGIRVNAVAPGFIATDILNTMPDKVLDGFRSACWQRRLGLPGEVANVYTFLASDDASFVNGTALEVSGGLSI